MKSSPGNAPTAPATPKDVKWNVGEAANQLSWDDLRIIKTLSECGNRAATAKKLGINVSTVSRRVSQVEKTLGVALFDHRKSGYLLTIEGAELRALAERVELDIVSVTRRVSRAGQGHSESFVSLPATHCCFTSSPPSSRTSRPSMKASRLRCWWATNH